MQARVQGVLALGLGVCCWAFCSWILVPEPSFLDPPFQAFPRRFDPRSWILVFGRFLGVFILIPGRFPGLFAPGSLISDYRSWILVPGVLSLFLVRPTAACTDCESSCRAKYFKSISGSGWEDGVLRGIKD